VIETILQILAVLKWVALFSLACSALVAGAVATNIRRARRRESLRQREHIKAVADSIGSKRVSTGPYEPPVITDRHHPLYCHGARRGPDITNREFYR
jgi:hypothetical protein